MTDGARPAPAFDDWERLAGGGEFEEVLDALRAAVAHLEAGHLRLTDSVRCYEVGATLARRCERLLGEAELRISKLEGEANAEPAPGQLF